ncbi:unnamed protein product [Rotaria sp. Silwood1]|nr:unnamed protein product [Rotaria sp. Silwood1]CAF1467933.1 unnamed protein product [Rotaria sp. Silwood1]CAF1470852.1 unnamed protein product [Rotaria sp. Silwood1]CAF3607426.1 unnamed protein product [Rotaria sp. Silwood1]CAF3611637.1 unnamed protein product [Rotaria sp. Silwood1]
MLSIIPYSSGIEVASAFTKTTGNNSLTLEQFQQVQLGWTRDQVTQFVGRPGKLITPQTPISPHNRNTIIVHYQGSIPSNVLQREPTVTFSFYNGILWKKNEKLLDLTSSYVITRDHCNQIQTGSPYQQVILTLGSKENAIEEANISSNKASMTIPVTIPIDWIPHMILNHPISLTRILYIVLTLP